MKHTSLKDLLKVLMFGKISPDDLHTLKERTLHSSEKELDGEFQSIWDAAETVIPMDREIKSEVLTNIHQQIDIPASSRTRAFSWIKAAVILLPVIISLGSYLYFSNKYERTPEEFNVMAESGHKTKILLPDGTYVWLNSDSKLSYASDFNQSNRVVKLEGEAFFDVKLNTDIDFIVRASDVNIIVKGTAFNVSAYKEDATVDVSLLRGRVRLESADHIFLTDLSPDQVASVLKENMKWVVHSCDAEIESLWTQNKLKFENAPAADVFRKLERWYGVKITVENMNEDIHYGFTLKSESLREILNEMDKITPIKYKINGEEVNITYK